MKLRQKVIFNLRCLTVLLFLTYFGVTQQVSADEQRLLQLIEYISVDYPEAVQEGEVVNAGEYREMLEFSNQVRLMVDELEDSDVKAALQSTAEALRQAIREKRNVAAIRVSVNRLWEPLISAYAVVLTPTAAPDISLGGELYQMACSSCHGKTGFGDGSASEGLDPPATNFVDMDRYKERTLYGLFNTISLGVEGTAMASFSHLSEAERWSLAFFVGTLAPRETERPASINIGSVKTLITITPATAYERWGNRGIREMAWLRRNPEILFGSRRSPLTFSKQKLGDVLVLYKSGQVEEAYDQSLQAYLEGFELVEPALRAFDAEFASNLEMAMGKLRSKLQARAPTTEIETVIRDLQSRLQQADRMLRVSRLSPVTAFTSALVIFLREGLEAMLVVIALVSFVGKTGRREAVMFIHFGWIGALVAGLMTWWVSSFLFRISGASREVTEGIAALTACAILLYVGFWMHDKSHANNWQLFIERQAEKALSSGALWGLSSLAFIAVYREVFETILFYQALWTQTSGFARQTVIYGFGAGVMLLAVVGLALYRYSKILPIRQFFALSAVLMFGLAFILAGKGIAALQEAGWIGSHSVSFVNIDVLGIHPYIEGLVLQSLILALGAGYWLYGTRD